MCVNAAKEIIILWLIMSKIVAVTNQKGGVGKTTTCVNLAASLAALKQDVLLIDLDPQGNATVGCGIEKHILEATANEVLLGEVAIQDALITLPIGFDLLASNSDLTLAEVSLLQVDGRENRLKTALAPIQDKFHYIIIDCPPSLNMLTINALVAADSVLIPMQCEYYALEGLTGLMGTINKLCETVNPKLQIEGLLRTMYDARNSLTLQVSEQLQSHFSDKLYTTTIPRNVRLAEAPSFGLPALLYDKTSSGAIAYLALAKEIVARNLPGQVAQPSQPDPQTTTPILLKQRHQEVT